MHPSLTRFEVAHTQVKEFVRNKILRVVIAFIIHRGRMSRSVAAGSLASDPVHRDELTRFLARPTWRKHDFNHPLIRMLLAQEIHVSVGAPIHHRDLKRVFYTPNSAGAKHRGAEGLGLRGMSVADVDAMRSARAIPSPPPEPLSPTRGEVEIDFVLKRAIDSCSYYPRCVEDPTRRACIRVEAN
jgi:hypothetical protein